MGITWDQFIADDNAAAYAEAVEAEKLDQLIEAEQCLFIDAADELCCVLMDGSDDDYTIDGVLEKLKLITENNAAYDRCLIRGLILAISVIDKAELSETESKVALSVVLDAMALHDHSADEPGSGQIEMQARQCSEYLSKDYA